MGDRRGELPATQRATRVLIALCAILCVVSAWAAESPVDRSRRYDIHLPRESVASALNDLSEQTGTPVVFPYDLVANRISTPVSGRFTLREALQELLRGTGLSGGLSDRGVLTVAAAPVETIPGELQVQKGQKNSSGQSNNAQGDRQIHVGHWAALVAGLTAAFGANGQTTESSANATNASDLGEIVVTAQKREEKLQDVPISIAVLQGAALDASTYIDTRDALATIPGLATVTSQVSGATVLSLRGVSSTGAMFAGSSPVAYYVDGVPFGLVRSAIVPDTNLYDLQRIEVLNGPQGTLYGASALNGVIRILTNDADLHDFDFKGRATDSTTEHGGENYDGDMAVNIPIVTDKLALRVVAGDEHYSGWVDSSYGNHTNDIDVGNERAKLDAQPTDTLSIDLSAWHSQVRAGGPPYADSSYFIPQSYGQHSFNMFNAYGLTVAQDMRTFEISSVSSYLVYDDNGTIDATATVPPSAFNLFTDTHSRVISEELNVASKTEGFLKWSGGFFYRDAEDTTYQGAGSSPATRSFDDQFRDTSKSEAVFGELGGRFFDDQLEITAGARYFHDDEGTQAWGTSSQLDIISSEGYSVAPASATSSVWTPRATISWKPRSDLTAYFSYGQGFRSGFPQGYFTQGLFPPAAPDKLTNYEVGVKGDALDQRLAYTVAAYYIHWTGVQQALTYIPASGPQKGIGEGVVANANAASGPGAEFSFTARPVKGWDISATFSWNDLTYDQTVYSDITAGAPLFLKGDRLDLSPEYTASLSTSYLFLLGSSGLSGQISASEQYISVLNSVDIQLGSEANAPSNSLLIARANFSVIIPDHWSVSLFADNLANYKGDTLANADTFYWDTRPTPRTVGVRIDYHLR